MKIATWNVNSVKARLENALAWLKEAKPDIVCLQELKCEDQAFPAPAFEELGYNVVTHGQKTYNGVAILSKQPPEDVRRGLAGEDEDAQARYIEAVVPRGSGAVRVASIYLPNGNPPDTDKFAYKLRWMDRLTAHAQDAAGARGAAGAGGRLQRDPHQRSMRRTPTPGRATRCSSPNPGRNSGAS